MDGIPHRTWAHYTFPHARYGHYTSNIVESLNSVWNLIKSLPPLKMIDAIWSTTMKTIYDRYNRPQQSTELTDIPLSKFKNRLKASQRYRVFESGNGIYQVQISDSGSKFIVHLSQMLCTCGNFFKYSGPCAHAITACKFETVDPYAYFHFAYSVRSYRKTYQSPIKPVSIEDLASDPDILPPKLCKLREQPKTKRIRKNAWKRQERKCKNCGQIGHNVRRCTGLPMAQNGRGERANNWQAVDEEDGSGSDIIIVDVGR